MKPLEGGINALLAAGSLIGVAVLFYYFVRNAFSSSLTNENLNSLSTFFLAAVVLGIATSVMVYLHGCYPKGTNCRLVFGLVAGAMIMVYALIVLVASGFSDVLSDIGLRMDMIYPALVIVYVAVYVMFCVAGEYKSSREDWLKKSKEPKKKAVKA